MNELEALYNELIMEHSMNSPYKHKLMKYDFSAKGHNPSCGDEITLEVMLEDGILKEMAFLGHGCAISQSSTSIMIETLTGKTVEEAKELVSLFIGMIKRELSDGADIESLEDAIAFQNVSNMPARVKCALLAWNTLNQYLDTLNKE